MRFYSLIALISSAAKESLYDFEQQHLMTFDRNQSTNESSDHHQITGVHQFPRDIWLAMTDFINPESMQTIKDLNRGCHSIVAEIETHEISIDFRELFQTTNLTPSDIAWSFRYLNPSMGFYKKSLMFQLIRRHHLVMVRGHSPSPLRTSYLCSQGIESNI